MLGSLAGPVEGKVYLSQEEALRLAFPGASVERKTAFLTEAEREEVARLAGGPKPAALQPYYVATKEGSITGTAYFDVHVVRTQNEVLMIVVKPDGSIGRLEVLSFFEPEEYLPRPGWYTQFPGKTLGDELSEKRAIRPVTGATLTVRATTEAARRVLALHRLLMKRPTP
ncbi:MAG TPA: FMN-binding protein [Thermoanaerobaculia bacterium]|nr:FMN-binding protein [Thermoanaerobaculia bacterium]